MGKKLYVGNLPYSVTDASLESLFSQAGKVESAKVISDQMTGRSKGFGFVEMSSDEEASAAISKFNGFETDGRTLKVSEAKPQSSQPNRGSFGRGGQSGGGGGFGRSRY